MKKIITQVLLLLTISLLAFNYVNAETSAVEAMDKVEAAADAVKDMAETCTCTEEEKAAGSCEAKGCTGKCGDGKCGDGKCGDGKCGEAEAEAEKCGEGKCGEGKCGS